MVHKILNTCTYATVIYITEVCTGTYFTVTLPIMRLHLSVWLPRLNFSHLNVKETCTSYLAVLPTHII